MVKEYSIMIHDIVQCYMFSKEGTFFVRNLLQAWPTAAVDVFHSTSNSCGATGNCMKRACFNCCSSLVGKPGKPRSPATVHWAITSSPNTASLASFTASVPILLLNLSFGCFMSTSLMVASLCLLMAEDGNATFPGFARIGSACTPGPGWLGWIDRNGARFW